MKRKRTWFCLLFALLASSACQMPAFGAGTQGAEEDVTLAPYFFIEGGDPSVDSLPLKETSVTTNIHGVIADTYVTQVYENGGSRPIHASYQFPASTRVSVHGMTMEVGDERITAKIKEKEEARQDFEEAKEEGKSASLLEQQRPNVFSMDVANIMPGDSIRIELHYTELIEPEEGTYEFVFPTVVGPRYSGQASGETAEGYRLVSTPYLPEGEEASGTYDITVNLSAGVPINELTCKSHKIDVKKAEPSVAQVTLADPEDFAGNRDFILDYKLTGEAVNSGLILNEGTDENFFMLTVQPPARYQPEEVLPREYIFVLDVSGSMWGYPLDTAKGLIRNLVSELRETDLFNVVLFSGASARLSPQSLPATGENIGRAIDFVDQEQGGGWTELAAALEDAISIPESGQMSRSIIVVTDGYISAEKEAFRLIEDHLAKTNFFSFGIGDSVNRYLIEGIAKAGQGEAFVVTDEEDAQKAAGRFWTYIEAPLLTDVQVAYEGFDAYDAGPSKLPTLFAQKPITLLGKWKGEPSGTIRITGKAGSEDYRQEIKVSDVKPLKDSDAIRYLWARKRVEQLTDYGNNDGESEDTVKEITRLGLNYSMMTPYTSFIAVSEKIRNASGDGTDVNQPLPLPQNVSNLAVGNPGYTLGAEPGGWMFALTAVFLAGVFLMRAKKAIKQGRDSHGGQ